MPDKKTLLIDFDWVMRNQATGEPIPGARKALCYLESKYRVVIFSTRPAPFIKSYMLQYGFPKFPITNIKEPAFLILDDRAITFTGEWNDELLERIKTFKPHWELLRS